MIYKELDPPDWDQLSTISRRTADEQMPYYLRRFFAKSDDVDVMNQLCVSTAGVVTQVDHLVLHSYGLVVIDSRSVSGRMQVRDDGRWVCLDRRQAQEIGSPIVAAYSRAGSLKAFLEKKVRQKGFFDQLELDVLVAAPDTEAIEWSAKGRLPEVCNADEVPRRVNETIAQYRSMGVGPGLLVAEQRRRLAEFLCFKHRPGVEALHAPD